MPKMDSPPSQTSRSTAVSSNTSTGSKTKPSAGRGSKPWVSTLKPFKAAATTDDLDRLRPISERSIFVMPAADLQTNITRKKGEDPQSRNNEDKLKSNQSEEDIDKSADNFIKKFRNQLKMQRLESIENYEQMLARGL